MRATSDKHELTRPGFQRLDEFRERFEFGKQEPSGDFAGILAINVEEDVNL
jgi:hypothetical protein